jgi:hypothetical protein
MTEIDLKKLAAPFPPDAVSWRAGPASNGKCKALAYIDARDVQDRLDAVCGPENWQVDFPWSDGKRLTCRIGIRVNGEWIWKGDGAGASDVEAEKGAFSDAFKRAAVRWAVGRYLYDIDGPWVEMKGKQIADNEFPRLRALLAKDARQAPAESSRPMPVETQTPPKPSAGAFKVTGLSKEAGAAGWATACDFMLRKAKSTDELDAILKDNSEALSKLEKDHPDLRRDLGKSFADMWKKLDHTALSAA